MTTLDFKRWQDEFRERMDELRPAVEEARFLEDMLRVIEQARPERTPSSRRPKPKRKRRRKRKVVQGSEYVTWPAILEWLHTKYDPTDVVKARDMAIYFDRTPQWARLRMKQLVEEGHLERYGNGLTRRPAIHTGESLRVHAGVGMVPSRADIGPAPEHWTPVPHERGGAGS